MNDKVIVSFHDVFSMYLFLIIGWKYVTVFNMYEEVIFASDIWILLAEIWIFFVRYYSNVQFIISTASPLLHLKKSHHTSVPFNSLTWDIPSLVIVFSHSF